MPRTDPAETFRRGVVRLVLGVFLAFVPGACGKVSEPLACRAPATSCGGACVDIATDVAHCGSCNAKCPGGDTCVDGACTSTGCPAHRHGCDGLCVDLRTNPLNCGACNVACDGAATCVVGACQCSAPGRVCSGACVDVESSQANCGACGNACAEGEKCEAGACVPRCAEPGVFCVDHCVVPSNDVQNCGACGVKCGPNEQCVSGACRCAADATHQDCGGSCADLATDGTNCGSCGVTCPAGKGCVQGTCSTVLCAANPFLGTTNSLFFCPSVSGDPLAECLEQARTASPIPPAPTLDDAEVTPLSPDLACQCQHCLKELTSCAKDPACTAAWLCGEQKRCTSPCWGGMGVCGVSAPACFKFCPPAIDVAQSQASVEALFRCTRDSQCGI
jgi:hypothetical protein